MTSHRTPRRSYRRHYSLALLAAICITIGAAIESVIVAGVHP